MNQFKIAWLSLDIVVTFRRFHPVIWWLNLLL